jgi:hypothetical protein
MWSFAPLSASAERALSFLEKPAAGPLANKVYIGGSFAFFEPKLGPTILLSSRPLFSRHGQLLLQYSAICCSSKTCLLVTSKAATRLCSYDTPEEREQQVRSPEEQEQQVKSPVSEGFAKLGGNAKCSGWGMATNTIQGTSARGRQGFPGIVLTDLTPAISPDVLENLTASQNLATRSSFALWLVCPSSTSVVAG